jgi:hypothetical protein
LSAEAPARLHSARIARVRGLVRGLLLGAVVAGAAGPARSEDPRLTATLESEWALGLRDAHSQKLEAILVPELDWQAAPGLRLVASARVRGDAFDRLEPGHPKPEEVSVLSRRYFAGDHVDYELRELRLETRLGAAHVTLGKQQVVWGEADGLKVLDVVDPQDFREFILDDFEDSRIPLWTLNVELPLGPVGLQAIWVPDPSFHELPEPDSVFAFTAPRFLPPRVPGFVPALEDVDRPRRLLADSDAGLRAHVLAGGWDLALSYLWQYAKEPVFEAALGVGPPGPTVTFTPTYRRTHVVGATASNAFGDLTVRAEAVWFSDRYVSTDDPRVADDLLVETDELGYVLGFDWFGFEDALVSLQLFQSWIPERAEGLVRDRLETVTTLFVRRELWNQRLRLEGMWLHGLNEQDGLVRPKLAYQLRNDLWVWLGLDLFYGGGDGVFGQYDARDRAVVGMEWGF